MKSSASAPSPFFLQAAFDAATDELLNWSFKMPDDYASAPVLKFQFKMASATSGVVIWQCRLAAVTDGDSADVDAKAFGTVNTGGSITVPGTAGFLKEGSITLTNADSLAAGDFVVLQFGRDADNGSDTATGDAELCSVLLSYTTT